MSCCLSTNALVICTGPGPGAKEAKTANNHLQFSSLCSPSPFHPPSTLPARVLILSEVGFAIVTWQTHYRTFLFCPSGRPHQLPINRPPQLDFLAHGSHQLSPKSVISANPSPQRPTVIENLGLLTPSSSFTEQLTCLVRIAGCNIQKIPSGPARLSD